MLFRVYGINPDVVHTITYTSIAVLAGALPLAPVGAGPREAAIVTLFYGYAPPPVLLSIGLLMTATMHIIPMILCIPLSTGLLNEIIANKVNISQDE